MLNENINQSHNIDDINEFAIIVQLNNFFDQNATCRIRVFLMCSIAPHIFLHGFCLNLWF